MSVKKFKFKEEAVNVKDVNFLKIVGDNTHYKIESAITSDFLILTAVDDPQKEQQITTDEIDFIDFARKEEVPVDKSTFLQQLQSIKNTNEAPKEMLDTRNDIQPKNFEEKQGELTTLGQLLNFGHSETTPQEEKNKTVKTANVEVDEKEKLIDAITFLIREGLRANLK